MVGYEGKFTMIYRKFNFFKNGYHFNDLFTIKHNYVSINKIKLRKNKNP